MKMTLGDGFNRRKKLGADLQNWIHRLQHAGKESRSFRTKEIEGANAYQPEDGSEQVRTRHYTIEECRKRIAEILEEDQDLALRISLTNQQAKAAIVDLDGNERTLSIPELLVLKADIVPKMEMAARAVPTRAEGVGVYEEGQGFVRYRTVKKVERKKETMSDKGLKIEEKETIGYDVVETTDYGIPQRKSWNEVDRIQDFLQQIKQAINRANKTELIELD
ncbi:MAG: hypothetical protein KJO07_17095 [Deltaproteobacteria bacterium]|jgi:hypothetical protein|nr:hypothetical protein [Deltaproteobacteria bacterium]